MRAIIYALLAAAFYAINVPFSKLLLDHVGAATMAALLYLGAGMGIGILSLRQPAPQMLPDRHPRRHKHRRAKGSAGVTTQRKDRNAGSNHTRSLNRSVKPVVPLRSGL